jgi:hypothetical protein
MVAGEAVKDFEPLYGEFYLPRKVCSALYSFQVVPYVAIVQNRGCGSTY